MPSNKYLHHVNNHFEVVINMQKRACSMTNTQQQLSVPIKSLWHSHNVPKEISGVFRSCIHRETKLPKFHCEVTWFPLRRYQHLTRLEKLN